MSPSRRRQFVPSRPRSEVYTAVAVGAGIVVGTALLIWLLRPGPVGVPGGGGLFARQPRMTILVLATAAVLAFVVSFVLRRRHPRFGTRAEVAVGSAAVLVLAVVGGVFWPGGVIRHWPKQPKVDSTPVTTPTTPVTVPTSVRTGSTVTPTTVIPPTATTPTTKRSSGSSTSAP